MKNKNIKKMFFLFSLLIILIGIVNATETNDETTIETPTDIIEEPIVSDTTPQTNNMLEKEKTITKKIDNQTKTSTIPTNITINPIKTTQYTDNVTISGNYKDTTGRILRYTPLTVKINTNDYKILTDINGDFSQKFRTNTMGTNTVTISFPGNSKFAGTTTTESFTVTKQTTKITINPITTVEYTDNVRITGKYTDKNEVNLRYTPITLNINGNKYTTTTNNYGEYTFHYKTNQAGTNTVTASYHGNQRYLAASMTTSFNVQPKTTKIMVENVYDVQYSDYTLINGYYKDKDDNPLRYTTLTFNINNEKQYTRTDQKGEFTLHYKTKTVGINNVTIMYGGNVRYKSTSTKTTFNVSNKLTTISLYVDNVQYSDNPHLEGIFYVDEFTYLRYTPLTIYINGEKYYSKTDENGFFSLNYKTNKLGLNTVTAMYPGNTRYSAASSTKTFYVTPKDTRIELTDIDDVDEILGYQTISGNYTDTSGNPLRYTTLIINIDGKNFHTKTDSLGKFEYSFKPNFTRYECITVSYPGNERYTGTSTSTKRSFFDTELYVDVPKKEDYRDINIDDNVVIEGYLKDKLRGYKLYGLPISITINGNTYYTTTDNGYYQYRFKVNKTGTNNVTVTYAGNNKYTKSSNKTTFLVVGKPTKITVINTIRSSDNQNIKIQGRIYDYECNMIKNLPLTLKIDGNNYYTQTDDNGLYTYNYKNNGQYTHTLTVLLEGNSTYAPNQEDITFIPLTNEGKIELLTPHANENDTDPDYDQWTSIKIGTDVIYGWYQKYEGQSPAGAHIMSFGKNDIDEKTANKITAVTFYYKNDNNGNMISIVGKDNDIDYDADNIDGYTPYKAIIEYRARTPQEIKGESMF